MAIQPDGRRVRRVLAALIGAGLAVPVLAACGANKADGAPGSETATAAGAAAPTDASSNEKKSIEMRRKEEDMIAACMRRSGFTYKPFVPPTMLNPVKQEPTEYEAIKAYRSKYGFASLFASVVYPNDPNIRQLGESDPNAAIKAALDPAQQVAYEKALAGRTEAESKTLAPSEGCIGGAVRAVDPQARKRAEETAHITDTNELPCEAVCQAQKAGENKVKPLEAAYTNCLKSKGIPMNENLTGSYTTQLSFKVVQKRFDAANKAAPGEDVKIDIDVARAELQKEIKVALDDLECGRTYIPAVNKFWQQASELAPVTGGLW